MAFDAEIQKTINAYVSAHVADEAWHTAYFDFIGDATLAQRLGEEFISTRYIYKILEGLEADDWMLRSQIRLQVMSYASIYEAVLHYLLFDFLGTEPRVVALTEFPTKKQISIPPASLALLEKYLEHDGKKIIPTYEAVGRTDDTRSDSTRKPNVLPRLE